MSDSNILWKCRNCCPFNSQVRWSQVLNVVHNLWWSHSVYNTRGVNKKPKTAMSRVWSKDIPILAGPKPL